MKEHGATATEYSILVGFIAIIILTGIGLFGLAVGGYFNQLSVAVRAALGLP
jgi:pilus assembly protein Flp/PilA